MSKAAPLNTAQTCTDDMNGELEVLWYLQAGCFFMKTFQANIVNHLIDEFVLAYGPVVEIDGSGSHHSNGTSRTRLDY